MFCYDKNYENYTNKKRVKDHCHYTGLRFIDSFGFMPTSLSELVDNMSGNFDGVECKSYTGNNRCEECKKLIEGLIKTFPSLYQFCNGDLNKFIFLLRKGVYPYEYMDSWEKSDETT